MITKKEDIKDGIDVAIGVSPKSIRIGRSIKARVLCAYLGDKFDAPGLMDYPTAITSSYCRFCDKTDYQIINGWTIIGESLIIQ